MSSTGRAIPTTFFGTCLASVEVCPYCSASPLPADDAYFVAQIRSAPAARQRRQAANVASDASPREASRDHVSRVRNARRPARASRWDGGGRRSPLKWCRGRTRQKERSPSTQTSHATSSTPCHMPSASTARERSPTAFARCSAKGFSTDRLRFPCSCSQFAASSAMPGGNFHAQRRGGYLAPRTRKPPRTR